MTYNKNKLHDLSDEALTEFLTENDDDVIVTDNDCFEYLNKIRPTFTFSGVTMPLYRWACFYSSGDIFNEERNVARHKCNNPRCFNPEHLHWGTIADNNKDRRNNAIDRGI